MQVKVKVTDEIKWPLSLPGFIPSSPGHVHLNITLIIVTAFWIVVRYTVRMCTEPPRQAIIYLFFSRGWLIPYLKFSAIYIYMMTSI